MNTPLRQGALAALLLLSAATAMAGAQVTFVNPEHFSDVPMADRERERVLKDLQLHFDKLAATLPAGQQLKVEVTDIDLAGQTWPTRLHGRDIRVLNGRADWPHMTLRYTITQGDQVVKSGDSKLSDMDYQHSPSHYANTDTLRYEKNMLDQWFRTLIAVR
ncbi:MAG: DUF3016 domain-containing protein [Pseudomonadota bacterium]